MPFRRLHACFTLAAVATTLVGIACGTDLENSLPAAAGNRSSSGGGSSSSGDDSSSSDATHSSAESSSAGSGGGGNGTGGSAHTGGSAQSSSSGVVDPCSAIRCNAPPSACFTTEGTCANGLCTYEPADGASCDDADTCTTNDACSNGVCSGLAVPCNAPPAPTCVDGDTLKVYQGSGACSAGTCAYDSAEVPCPNCPNCDPCASVVCNSPPSACFASQGTCSNGLCTYGYADGGSCNDGDACTTGDICASGVCSGAAVACNDPPAPTCVSSVTLRTYTAGRCSGGTCEYDYIETVCREGCAGSACNPPPNPDVELVSAGYAHTCAVTQAGAVKCWGSNASCQVGDDFLDVVKVPVTVIVDGAVSVSAGMVHTCARFQGSLVDGIPMCWGTNNHGQLGNDSPLACSPVLVAGLSSSGTAAISANGHSCALTPSGGVKCWGANERGQLGNNTQSDSQVPVDVVGLGSGVAAVSVGGSHTCALTQSGGVKCWGDNWWGQLGNNASQTQSNAPVDVQGLASGIVAVSAGTYHTCALRQGGGVKCWGYNQYGEVGNNSVANSLVPVDVVGIASGAVAVSAGGFHSCALMQNKGVKCWGYNALGQLGNLWGNDSHVPVDVVDLASAISISAGGVHTCVSTDSGGIKCWGGNGYGQLGNNSLSDSYFPVSAIGF